PVWAWGDRPSRAVPGLDQRPEVLALRLRVTANRHTEGRTGTRHTVERVCQGGIWAGGDGPGGGDGTSLSRRQHQPTHQSRHAHPTQAKPRLTTFARAGATVVCPIGSPTPYRP